MAKLTDKPLVSIVIPVYNGSNYLREAIDSALAQTYKNIEVLVINDGSTDHGATDKIAESYGDKIRYFSKENGGVATALNLGIKEMKGDYFSWLSHDDLYEPERIEVMLSKSMRHKDRLNLVIASSYSYFDENGGYPPATYKEAAPAHPLSYLLLGYINGCSLLVPTKLIRQTGFFDESFPTTQDFDYWFRLLRSNRIIYIDQPLTLSRSHPGQGSKALLKAHITECDDLWVSIMNTLSDKEKESIFGSKERFFSTVRNFLSANTLYHGAIQFARIGELEAMGVRFKSETFSPNFVARYKYEPLDNRKTIFFPLLGNFDEHGGLNRMVSLLANSLSDKYNVVIGAYGNYKKGYHLNSNVGYFQISTEQLDVANFQDLAVIIGADVTIVSNNCTYEGLMLSEWLSKNGHKVIAWNHEDYFLPYTSLKYRNVWPIRKKIQNELACSVWLTNNSFNAYAVDANNGVVIPNFIHTSKGESRTGNNELHNNIVAVARFNDRRKRLGMLIECYEKIYRRNNQLSLTIVGPIDGVIEYQDGESVAEAVKRINAHGGSIIIAGVQNDVEKYYQSSDLHILPSYGEGFGITILESAMHGVPSVVFDNSGFRDIITDGVDGLVCNEGNTDEMAGRIIKLYSDKKSLLDMKKATVNIAVKFSEDRVMDKWRTLLRDVIENKSQKSGKKKPTLHDAQKFIAEYERSFSYIYENDIHDHDVDTMAIDSLFSHQKNLLEENSQYLQKLLDDVYNSKRWIYSGYVVNLIKRISR